MCVRARLSPLLTVDFASLTCYLYIHSFTGGRLRSGRSAGGGCSHGRFPRRRGGGGGVEGEGDGILVSAKPGNLRISLKKYQWYSNLSLYGSGVLLSATFHRSVLNLLLISFFLLPSSFLLPPSQVGTQPRDELWNARHDARSPRGGRHQHLPQLPRPTSRRPDRQVRSYDCNDLCF